MLEAYHFVLFEYRGFDRGCKHYYIASHAARHADRLRSCTQEWPLETFGVCSVLSCEGVSRFLTIHMFVVLRIREVTTCIGDTKGPSVGLMLYTP